MVYPKYPKTFWSFHFALKFIAKKASNPPLGLLTIASILPAEWEKKLVDLNVSSLSNRDIQWADYIFISAMLIQQASVLEVIKRCKEQNKKVVAGGPLFTEEYENYQQADHLILNEAEVTLPHFIRDLQTNKAKRVYESKEFPDITKSPVPDYSLLDISKYSSLSIQFSRGCPYDCEFCDITALFGRKVRLKSTGQILQELDNLKKKRWKRSVFFVDDNFIGNKKVLKEDLLPAMIRWRKRNHNPFGFITEASINLADDPELMEMMVKAGFDSVFVGIETPDEASLTECNKTQNRNRDLIGSVKSIQQAGLEVSAGFIVGFDGDSPFIFQRQIDFIQQSKIVTAMVGLLNAPKKTRLYKRLKSEGRITSDFEGDNTNYALNFIPKMNKKELLEGYRKIIEGIYSRKPYYKRVKDFMKVFNPRSNSKTLITLADIKTFIRSVFILGFIDHARVYYWKLLFWSLFNKPKSFRLAIVYSIYGYHFRKVFREIL